MSKNIAVVCGSYHKKEIEMMLELARDQAEKEGLTISQVVWVPGAMEVPLALNRIVNASGESLVGAACLGICLLYTSPSPRDMRRSRMPSSA